MAQEALGGGGGRATTRYGDDNRAPLFSPKYADDRRTSLSPSKPSIKSLFDNVGKTPALRAAGASAPLTFNAPAAPKTVLPKYNPATYSPAPAALDANEIASFDARRRAATRNYQQALIDQQVGTQAANLGFKQSRRSIGKAAVGAELEAREGRAAAGLVFAPKYMGRDLVDIRDMRQERLNDAAVSRTQQLQGLASSVNSAKNSREAEIAAIAAEAAARQAELNRLIRGTGA